MSGNLSEAELSIARPDENKAALVIQRRYRERKARKGGGRR